jgi:hypothetical protein
VIRRLLAYAVAAELVVALLALSAVAHRPRPPADPHRVRIWVTFRPDGRADLAVAPGGRLTDAEVQRKAGALVGPLFLHGSEHGTRVRHGVLYADGLPGFEPGSEPMLRLRGDRAWEVLRANGWTSVDLDLTVPAVSTLHPRWDHPAHRVSWHEWRWRGTGQLPAGTVSARPDATTGWTGALLMVAALAAAWCGISLWPGRRTRARTWCGAGALVALLGVTMTAWPAAELGAAGVASGFWLDALRVLSALWAPVLLVALGVILLPRRVRRSAP